MRAEPTRESQSVFANAAGFVRANLKSFEATGKALDAQFSERVMREAIRRDDDFFAAHGSAPTGPNQVAARLSPCGRYHEAQRWANGLDPSVIGIDTARKVLLLAWLAFDRDAHRARPIVSEWQHLEFIPDERFWEGRQHDLSDRFADIVLVALQVAELASQKRPAKTSKYQWLAKALQLRHEHADWSDARIAREAGISPTRLSRNETYRKARDLARMNAKAQRNATRNDGR